MRIKWNETWIVIEGFHCFSFADQLKFYSIWKCFLNHFVTPFKRLKVNGIFKCKQMLFETFYMYLQTSSEQRKPWNRITRCIGLLDDVHMYTNALKMDAFQQALTPIADAWKQCFEPRFVLLIPISSIVFRQSSSIQIQQTKRIFRPTKFAHILTTINFLRRRDKFSFF